MQRKPLRMAQALGNPVEPEVYTRMAMSVGRRLEGETEEGLLD